MKQTQAKYFKAVSGAQDRITWSALACFALIPIWVLTTTALTGNLSWGDSQVVAYMLANRQPVMDWLMLAISWISSEYATPAILITLLILLWRRNRSTVLYAVIITASSTLWQILLKAVVGRLRPEPVLYPVWQGAGYPSGHTLTALVTIYMIWRLAPHLHISRSITRGLGWAVLFWPVLVGASRIYLNAHYLSDVVGGYLLGVWHLGLAFALLGTGWLARGTVPLAHIDKEAENL